LAALNQHIIAEYFRQPKVGASRLASQEQGTDQSNGEAI
jgi:hypothetical protein